MENGGDKNTNDEVMSEKPVQESKPGEVKSDETKSIVDNNVVEKTDETKTAVDKTVETKMAVDKTDETKMAVDNGEETKLADDKNGETKSVVDKPEETKVADGTATDDDKVDGVKSEEPSKELLGKIKTQIEFYFGDINLQRDKFLIDQTKLDEGWIPLTVMLTFKMLASMSKDQDVILKALEDSELIVISEDRKKIRRSPDKPLPVFDEAYRKAQAERTVYVKGFPRTGITIQKLKEFFKDHEPIENIIMRKYQDSDKKLQFKGSIFIQFKSLEGAKAFMAKESIKYEDTELIRKFSEEYSVEKSKEREERKLKKGKKEPKNDENAKDGGEDDEPEISGFPKGTILQFEILKNGHLLREDIKEEITNLGVSVAFIDFQKGADGGYVRLEHENSGKTVIDKLENNELMIKNVKATFRLLEGAEESEYMEVIRSTIKQLRKRVKGGRRGRSKRGRGAGQRGNKRHGSPAHGAVPNKKSNSD